MQQKKLWSNSALSVLLLALITLFTGCAALGKIVSGAMTSKISNLSEAAVQVRYVDNLYPSETGTTEAEYLPQLWQEGKDLVTIQFVKRKGIGFYEIDGDVTLNGEKLEHIANGFYGKFLENEDRGPKTFVVTAGGKTTSFTVQPPTPVNLVSVNDRKDGAVVDLSKDLTLEMETANINPDTRVRVAILMDALGTRSFSDVAIIKPAGKVTIPASAFRHTALGTSGQSGVVNYKTGESYLLIERFDLGKERNRDVGGNQTISAGWSSMPVTVTGSIKDPVGTIAVEGSTGSGNMAMTYTASKPNAFLGKPFSEAKKFAVSSLTVRGVMYKQTVSTSSHTTGNIKTTTTSTKTWQFPKLSDAFWDQLLENTYKDVTATLSGMYGVEFVPVDKVTKAASYQYLTPIPDKNTSVEVEKGYKGTKNILPTSISEIVGDISNTFASDRFDSRLINELGVDGLVAVTIDLGIPTDRDEIVLQPVMSYRITGAPNGYIAGPTVYAQGVIAGDGVPSNIIEFGDINALNRVIRKDDLMTAFRKSLEDLNSREKSENYAGVWNLQ